MSYIIDHKQKFEDLNSQIENQTQLRRQANGGNSILFCYAPGEEQLYINKAKELYRSQARFIDISRLLVETIDKDGWESFSQYYCDFASSPHLVFHSDDPEPDLFDLIINSVAEASEYGHIPFVIRTGCLFGTGIDNVNIMENKTVMGLSHPVVIFYPSRIDEDNIYFLNFKPASKYRCTLVR